MRLFTGDIESTGDIMTVAFSAFTVAFSSSLSFSSRCLQAPSLGVPVELAKLDKNPLEAPKWKI
jgi:hypothetical protein